MWRNRARTLGVAQGVLWPTVYLTVALSPARAQAPPAASPRGDDPDSRRLQELDRTIDQRLAAGQLAEAIPLAREKLDRLIGSRGKDHWETGNARRELETYRRLATQPRAVQERYAKARRATDQAVQLYGRGRYRE